MDRLLQLLYLFVQGIRNGPLPVELLEGCRNDAVVDEAGNSVESLGEVFGLVEPPSELRSFDLPPQFLSYFENTPAALLRLVLLNVLDGRRSSRVRRHR